MALCALARSKMLYMSEVFIVSVDVKDENEILTAFKTDN